MILFLQVVANIPFNISTEVVKLLLPMGNTFSDVVLLLQVCYLNWYPCFPKLIFERVSATIKSIKRSNRDVNMCRAVTWVAWPCAMPWPYQFACCAVSILQRMVTTRHWHAYRAVTEPSRAVTYPVTAWLFVHP